MIIYSSMQKTRQDIKRPFMISAILIIDYEIRIKTIKEYFNSIKLFGVDIESIQDTLCISTDLKYYSSIDCINAIENAVTEFMKRLELENKISNTLNSINTTLDSQESYLDKAIYVPLENNESSNLYEDINNIICRNIFDDGIIQEADSSNENSIHDAETEPIFTIEQKEIQKSQVLENNLNKTLRKITRISDKYKNNEYSEDEIKHKIDKICDHINERKNDEEYMKSLMKKLIKDRIKSIPKTKEMQDYIDSQISINEESVYIDYALIEILKQLDKKKNLRGSFHKYQSIRRIFQKILKNFHALEIEENKYGVVLDVSSLLENDHKEVKSINSIYKKTKIINKTEGKRIQKKQRSEMRKMYSPSKLRKKLEESIDCDRYNEYDKYSFDMNISNTEMNIITRMEEICKYEDNYEKTEKSANNNQHDSILSFVKQEVRNIYGEIDLRNSTIDSINGLLGQELFDEIIERYNLMHNEEDMHIAYDQPEKPKCDEGMQMGYKPIHKEGVRVEYELNYKEDMRMEYDQSEKPKCDEGMRMGYKPSSKQEIDYNSAKYNKKRNANYMEMNHRNDIIFGNPIISYQKDDEHIKSFVSKLSQESGIDQDELNTWSIEELKELLDTYQIKYK